MIENWLTSTYHRMSTKAVVLQMSRLTVLAWEKRLSFQHFRKDATRTPDIDCRLSSLAPAYHSSRTKLTSDIVLLPSQHDFRRSVISGRYVSGHLGILNSRQTKVTDLYNEKAVSGKIPASQDDHPGRTFKSQFSLTRILLGFKSRCTTPAECTYFKPRCESRSLALGRLHCGGMTHQYLVQEVLDELLFQRPRGQ